MKPKIRLLILFLTLSISSAFSQSFKNPEVKLLIDSTISIMKNNAVNAGKVDWAAIQKQAYEGSINLNSPYELGNVMRSIYKSIDDFHGKFFYRDSSFYWAGSKTVIPESVKQEWTKGAHIKTAVLSSNLAYLRVPSMSGGGRADFDKKAQDLNDSLCAILNRRPKGIILDLRLDGGGAMFPMILGLKQLLGEGKVGSFRGRQSKDWHIKNNTFLVDTLLLTAITPKCTVNATALPCVLLVGPGTGSSGEFLTMTFKTRKKTTLIGTETAGYITSVAGFDTGNYGYIYLSVGYGADRNGRLYTSAIVPDMVIAADDGFNDLANDKKVQAAIKWLANKH